MDSEIGGSGIESTEFETNIKRPETIRDFLEMYRRDEMEWDLLKNCAVEVCTAGLKGINVMGNISGRVKVIESLKTKLEKRDSREEYQDLESIIDDRLDFVGLRISLYFPDQQQDVIRMIKENFHYDSMRLFEGDKKSDESSVYQNRFGQYVADHIWVSLLEKDRMVAGKHSNHKFEIQLRSVLMDAWARISHELEYKALSGDLSNTEHKLLDALKGHVEVGEMLLEQLHQAHI